VSIFRLAFIASGEKVNIPKTIVLIRLLWIISSAPLLLDRIHCQKRVQGRIKLILRRETSPAPLSIVGEG
jgi:hypothetical protein